MDIFLQPIQWLFEIIIGIIQTIFSIGLGLLTHKEGWIIIAIAIGLGIRDELRHKNRMDFLETMDDIKDVEQVYEKHKDDKPVDFNSPTWRRVRPSQRKRDFKPPSSSSE